MATTDPNFILYTTVDGDMYDLISYKMYGSEYHVDQIIDANPLYFNVIRFTTGFVLNIPILSVETVIPNPPWVTVSSTP